MNIPKIGQLQVWWIPQIPMKAFRVNVDSLKEAKLLLHTLADYDIFQFENNIKPDFSNAGGLQVYTEEGWEDWCDDEGRDIDEISSEEVSRIQSVKVT